MPTFADELTARIRSEPLFLADMKLVCATAISRLVAIKPESDPVSINIATSRILESASIFAQSSRSCDRALAQDLALYSVFSDSDLTRKEYARDILACLGNHPGVTQLDESMGLGYRSLRSFTSNRLLRSLSSVPINGIETPLTDFQNEVWTRIAPGKAVAVSAPTSAGKSFIVVEYLCQQALLHKRFTAAFIAPTRALLSEINAKISARLSSSTDIRVSSVPTPDPDGKPKQIFVLTQERMQALLSVWAGSFDLVVVDEAQNIGDESRGIILQDSLEQIHQRSSQTRFLFLAPSATGFSNIENATGIQGLDVVDTDLSPVLQNRVIVEPLAGEPKSLTLRLLTTTGVLDVGVYRGERGFASPDTVLATVALELGSGGASLVYGPSASQTEKIAGTIASGVDAKPSVKLQELSDFVVRHVHEKYSLATQVLKGVSTHYGKMPSLLREAIEDSFKNGDLKYLVCTTTLFQGVNLPARNVFIDTPTRGRKGQKTELDPAQLWNFAGRAGRLGKDVVGNVFLIGYDKWSTQALTTKVKYNISPSFKKILLDHRELVEKCLLGNKLERDREVPVAAIQSTAGLLISRTASGSIRPFLTRAIQGAMTQEKQDQLIRLAESACARLQVPQVILRANWTIDPFGLNRLYTRIISLIAEGKIDDIIPIHPGSRNRDPLPIYFDIFRRINHYVLGYRSIPFANKLAYTSLSWMRGLPLPALIAESIRYTEKKRESNPRSKGINYDSQIRSVFDFVEDQLRFTYVQLGRAYIDLLAYALRDANLEEKAREIYNFPLALELGVSSVAGQAFIELGLSRISAATFERLIPNSNPTVDEARKWLLGLSGTEFDLSPVIWEELRRKALVAQKRDE